eukprot:jgi/Botrbrau1/4214/Bobra.0044s0017.1
MRKMWSGSTSTTISPESLQNHGLVVAPHKQTKVIHLIRHAVGFHNVGYAQNHDAHLTPFGWQQTEVLRNHIQSSQPPYNVEVVIVSPLTRTLETAVGVFGGNTIPEESAMDVDGSPPDVLMVGQGAVENTRSARPSVAAPTGLPFIACELCRERVGPNRCDSRRDIRETRAAFPGVDFSLIEEGPDGIWEENHHIQQTSGCYPVGEGEDAVMARGVAFFRWLMQRPEKRIAVVSHAGFLKHTLQAFHGKLSQEFVNCEMRTLVVTDTQNSVEPPHEPTRFPAAPPLSAAQLP